MMISESRSEQYYWRRRSEILPSFPKNMGKLGAPCLYVEGVSLRFGGIVALEHAMLETRMGEIHSIVGPNGAGKTSLLNCINGIYRPFEGKILFEGKDIVGMKPHQVASLGIGRSFQRIALFKGMTVLENVLVGRHLFIKAGPLAGVAYWGSAVHEDIENQSLAEEILEFMEIEHLRSKRVGELSYGLQKRVEFARALALQPKLLLLDEPVAGMNLEEKEDIARFILDIKEELGMAVLLIEHELDMVMDISDRVTVLNFGRIITSGVPSEIASNPAVKEAYLGTR